MTTLPRVAAACAAVTVGSATNVRAQFPNIPVGTRVRVVIVSPTAEVVGRIESQVADTIAVETRTATWRLPASAVQRIDVSDGVSHGSGAAHGAQVGALVVGGSIVFLLVADHLMTLNRSTCSGECIDLLGYAPVLGAFGAGIGALAGGIIGASAGAEQWHELYWAPPSPYIPSPRKGAMRIGLSFHF